MSRFNPVAREAGSVVLGWLLVTAAVAGLAAVAVVLAAAAVGSLSQGVASHSPRQEAAEVAVEEVERRWRAEYPASAADAQRVNRLYALRCRRVGILYPEVALAPEARAGVYAGDGGGWEAGGSPACTLA